MKMDEQSNKKKPTLTLKNKPPSRSKRNKEAFKWMKEFPVFKDKLVPWKTGLYQDLLIEYRKEEYIFLPKDLKWLMYNLRLRDIYSAAIISGQPRYDLFGNVVDSNNEK